MLLEGQLSDWSVEDLLQMLHITKKSASLHIDGAERSGVVYFDEGAIVGAEVSHGAAGSDDRETAVEALYVLRLLTDGAFEIRNEVPSTVIDPVSVADALELASKHLDAEKALADTGLLNARGLRLAQEIDEPIILSERIWAAISVSIPAFTFDELEGRMGRAAAVDTLEQFRDLGVLEAVLDEPVEETAPVVVEDGLEPEETSHAFTVDERDIDLDDATDVVVEPEDAVEPVEIPEPEETSYAFTVDERDIDPVDATDVVIEPEDEEPSMWMAEADDTFDQFEASEDWSVEDVDDGDVEVDDVTASGWEAPIADESESDSVESQAAPSLSEAIRAAAAASPVREMPAASLMSELLDGSDDGDSDGDDESLLLAEAASPADFDVVPTVVSDVRSGRSSRPLRRRSCRVSWTISVRASGARPLATEGPVHADGGNRALINSMMVATAPIFIPPGMMMSAWRFDRSTNSRCIGRTVARYWRRTESAVLPRSWMSR